MSINGMMIHTCTIERDAQTIRGSYNTNMKSSWQPHAEDVPCRLVPQVSNVRGMGGTVGEASNVGLKESVKRVVRVILPRGLDITEQDRIVDVKFTNGVVLEPGPINILLIRPAEKRSSHHLNVIGERVF
ncbi:hypothetical protein LCGC14_0577560 [marine sediment metagenome]|uniref:Uncharacterized protein n=1 Tax=marine sediment metagenome TaxID=412755 RepID=A0A0F9UQP0_9ZZZZ